MEVNCLFCKKTPGHVLSYKYGREKIVTVTMNTETLRCESDDQKRFILHSFEDIYVK